MGMMLHLNRVPKISWPSILRPIRSSANVSVAIDNVDFDKEWANAKPLEDVPKIPSIPFFGSLWTLLPIIGKYNFRKMHKAAVMKNQEYGNILREEINANIKFVHVFDPKDFEKVFRNEPKYPERQQLQCIAAIQKEEKIQYTKKAMANSNGEEWWALRSKVQGHMLKPRTTINYLPAMDKVAQDFIERMKDLKDPTSLEINNYMEELNRWALESIGLVALDTRLGCLDSNLAQDSEPMKMIRGAGRIFDMMYRLEFKSPFWRLYRTPLYKRLCDSLEFVFMVANKYISQAKERLEKQQDEDREPSLLERLILDKIEPDQIAALINDMFIAGIDTTSSSVGFFLYHMSSHSDEQEKLYAEIKRLLPEKNSPITKQVLNDARYLKACIRESMRLLPVAGGTMRKMDKDIVLAGHRIPAGYNILMHTYVAGINENNVKEPNKFKPERWLRGSAETKNPFISLPFGFGVRSCIGRRIAEQEIYVILLRILQQFRVEYHYGEMDQFTRMLSTPDKPLRYQFHERK